MQLAFGIRAWSAIAPGLENSAQWQQWAARAECPQGDLVVGASHIPAMARRRLGHVAKMAITVVDAVLQDVPDPDVPVVWASRYGDAEKSLALLQQQAQHEPLSPTAFGLSVHNGVGAQHSILRGVRANAVCIASSHAAPEAGVVEAVGLLNEGAEQVLLVCYDAGLPPDYRGFHDEPMVDHAWAVMVTLPTAGSECFALEARAPDDIRTADAAASTAASLPHALDVLHFFLQPQRATLTQSHAHGSWHW